MRIEDLDGMFVGTLTDTERKALDDAIAARKARVTYEGAAGLLGLGKVQVRKRGIADREPPAPIEVAYASLIFSDGTETTLAPPDEWPLDSVTGRCVVGWRAYDAARRMLLEEPIHLQGDSYHPPMELRFSF